MRPGSARVRVRILLTATLAAAGSSTLLSISPEAALVVNTNPDAADLICSSIARSGSARSTPSTDPAPVLNEPGPGLEMGKLPGLSLEKASVSKPLRIGLWGDSHLAAGVISNELTRILAAQGIETQTDVLPPTIGRPGVARLPIRRYCMSNRWELEAAYRSKTPITTGLALADQRSTGRDAYLWLDLRDAQRQPTISGVRIQYLAAGESAQVAISVDDGPENRVLLGRTGAGPLGSAGVSIRGSNGPLSTIKLRVIEGIVQFQGLVLTHQRQAPVVLDVFGLPSATAHGWAMTDSAYLSEALRGMNYDAVLLEYGTNEGNVRNFDRAVYRQELAESLAAMRRVFPSSSCLLMAPPDRGVVARVVRSKSTKTKKGKKPTKPARPASVDQFKFSKIHEEITAVQSEVGASFNCETWNWQALMGGRGGAYAWAATEPPTTSGDLTHLTVPGYRKTADALANALGWTRRHASSSD